MSKVGTKWPEKSLGELCSSPDDIKCGPFGTQLNKSEFREEGVPLWGIKHVNKYFSIPTDEFLEPATAHRLNQYDLISGDLVMTRKGTVGNCAIYPSEFSPGIMHSDLLRLRLDLTRCDPGYFLHQLHHSSDVARQLALISGGAIMPGINVGKLKSIKVVAPPLPEQRRIALILDKAEALRAKRRAALAKLDTLAQSIFLEMFGDPATNPKGWPEFELQAVVKSGTIVTYGIVQAGEEYPNGVPYIRTGDIANGEIIESGLRRTNPEIAAKFSRSRVEAGDIVMSIRATVGTTAIVTESIYGANLTQGTARIAPGENTNSAYLNNFIQSKSTQIWIGQQVKGATFREITLSRLREMPVLLPPLPLQQAFARRVEAIETLKVAHRASLAKLDALFASLQHRAFRGEL